MVQKRFVGIKDGVEYPDPTPVELPTRLRAPGSQVDRIRELVRRELSQQARDQGFESFEEADDFELDDEEWASPYEEVFEPAEPAATNDVSVADRARERVKPPVGVDPETGGPAQGGEAEKADPPPAKQK